MPTYITNPPWVDGPSDIYQAWLRKVVRLTMLRSYNCLSRRRAVEDDVKTQTDDLYQKTLIKLQLLEKDGTPYTSRFSDLHQELIFRFVRDYVLFVKALSVVLYVIRYVPAKPLTLEKYRDRVKVLKRPILIIPKSLHPVASAAL